MCTKTYTSYILEMMAKKQTKYKYTRTVNYQHIDLQLDLLMTMISIVSFNWTWLNQTVNDASLNSAIIRYVYVELSMSLVRVCLTMSTETGVENGFPLINFFSWSAYLKCSIEINVNCGPLHSIILQLLI